MTYRDASRALMFKLWVRPGVYQSGLKMNLDSVRTLRVIDKDTKKWDELANLVSISASVVRDAHGRNVKDQYNMATNLILLITKEYNIK